MDEHYVGDKMAIKCTVSRLNISDGPLSSLDVTDGGKMVTVMVCNEKTGRDYEKWCKHGTKVVIEGCNVNYYGMKYFEVSSIKLA